MSAIMGIIGQNRVAGQKLIESTQDDFFDYDKYIKNYEKIRSEILEKEPLKLKKGALNILNYCKEHGIRMAIATSTYREKQVWKVRHIVLTHEDANDVLQNVFLKAWKNLETFQGKSSLSTWLYRIAVNESLDFLRKRKQEGMASEIENAGVANQLLADNYFDGDETQAQLQEAVSKLPEVQRTVFTMKYFEDMKYSEISKILNTSEGALKASYHLAVKKITEYFENKD